jgi:hypothetical protein
LFRGITGLDDVAALGFEVIRGGSQPSRPEPLSTEVLAFSACISSWGLAPAIAGLIEPEAVKISSRKIRICAGNGLTPDLHPGMCQINLLGADHAPLDALLWDLLD